MILKPVPVKDVDFSRYGVYINLKESKLQKSGDTWSCSTSEEIIMGVDAPFGYVETEPMPFVVDTMERNIVSREMQICGNGPIVLVVADTEQDRPKTEDMLAVILYPGDCIVLHKGIWHDACRGLEDKVYYYYSSNLDETSQWIEVEGEKVEVTL